MELIPCNENARRCLAESLFEVNEAGIINKKSADYVARTFPSILLDIARFLTEQASKCAREPNSDPATVIRHQLKPYLMFNLLLGKSPQITGLMYNYFENSSFQPLPEDLFQWNSSEQKICYAHAGFYDELVKEILLSYFKYLSFNPKWFSAVWNWSELGRFITLHPNHDIRYLATCCLSIITKPNRPQHISFMRDIIGPDEYQILIDLQIRHRHIFDNSFKPCIETNKQRAIDYVRSIGSSPSGYSYCQESIAKVANILLIKRDISLEIEHEPEAQSQYEKVIKAYVPVATLNDTISKIAYSLSINKPCLIRGPCGSGKTVILDYIAAHTNRLNPPDYVKVQIGDQIDSKLLIGSYVCTEIPGQFEWQPGPLTKAMAYGSWIVFEDIDSAPSDMAQVIHSVIENGNLSCVSCCPTKLDNPHPDFRILFTQRMRQSKIPEAFKLGLGFVERLCDIIDMPELSDADLKEVLEARYKFGELTQTILQLFRAAEKAVTESNINRASRIISLRDLFKFCDRLSTHKFRPISGKFASNDLEYIYLDAIDCFLSSVSKTDLKPWAEYLGQIVNMPSNEVRRLVFDRKPDTREKSGTFTVGRAELESRIGGSDMTLKPRLTLAYTKQSLQLIESVSLCIKHREPVLLVGETGVGKTSIIQHLANLMKTELIVINLSQQSDSSDLLGGYKPVDMREVIRPLHNKFEELFQITFDVESNQTFLHHVNNYFASSKKNSSWATYLKLLCRMCPKALDKPLPKASLKSWRDLHDKARKLSKRITTEKDSSSMALAFSEGSLLRAVKDGRWILLDEINLAEPDVLQCLFLILDSINKPHVYMQNSNDDEKALRIHPNFRIFACMNPSTDIGKRDLAIGTRGRFSEFFVDDVTDQSDLRLIVESYVKTCLTSPQIENIVNFYREIRVRSNLLSDISGNSPVYSLRTLCRALSICSNNVCHNMEKSLFESLKITFLQQLNEPSIIQVMKLIEQTVFIKKDISSLSNTVISMPKDDHQYVNVEGFWVQKSNEEPSVDNKYIVTKSVTKNLQSLSRIVSLSQRRLPILIQGNTSVGKTSLIMYLAKITGNKCYRINNHEHTDLQEYVGRYVLKENGELTFQQGLLVRAMKKGYWIILDELNLAPCELLEALNRVLDDNRELFIPETRETIKGHSKFMLFATQNPPEEYAGRKLLSRAFRNRFIELHFDEIPGDELEFILQRRCEMAPKYAKKIVSVMKELQMLRRESGCFNGKNGFMTMRDLFRWGERYAIFKTQVPDNTFFDWDTHIASEGLILLEGRVRTINEADTVKSIIEKVFKCKLDREIVYGKKTYMSSDFPAQFSHIHFSKEFTKLYVQLTRALKYKEPVLLCGQTGCGKTTACQLYAGAKKQKLITYNCHLNTESSDFVGGVRPSRQEESLDSPAKQTFPWINGPLVEAMKNGAIFLMDEISLADDAVLERINSVLEPTRSITLTEKDGEEIFSNESFRLVATMNPGGDYGKKELSPALRNRFTEIYCHNTTDIEQIRTIIEGCLSPPLLKPKIAPYLLSVIHQFLKEYYKNHDIVSIRDVISWSKFMNKTTQVAQPRPLSIQEAIINGVSLVFFDQFGTCGHKTIAMNADHQLKVHLKIKLRSLVERKFGPINKYAGNITECLEINHDIVKFKKFFLLKGPMPIYESIQNEFVLDAPIVRKNMMKIVRAMQLDRPILLEGDPGAGKTSVVSALAKLTGHKLIRINLSEQTDISDLFGSDLPDTTISDDETSSFCWHDGPMLRAIKDSHWILLDEMNLASQSVLEGLNACFDHRGEIYIPELNKRILINRTTTRIFACQNPYSQGAARKGLPQSFLNRFTSIYIESHSPKDLSMIIKKLYPNLPDNLIEKMVKFNSKVSLLYQNSGFEFNLRDILYWCDLMARYVRGTEFRDLDLYKPDRFVQFVYLDRMRSSFDRTEISDLFEQIFSCPIYEPPYRDIRVGEYSLMMARSILSRKTRPPPHLSELCILKYQMPYIESIAKAIEYKKMPIIVGDSGVGKRTMIRILAGLTGNELNIIGANREMDTVELLGSFEQKSLQREIVDLVEEAKLCITVMINSISQKRSASTWSQFFSHIWATLYATSIRDLKLSKNEMMDAYRLQLNQVKKLIDKIQPFSSSHTEDKCKELTSRINRLMRKFLYYTESMYSSGNFEWIDSILVKSIKEGTWLMIENANLMNPATLDRLNSLVETNGSLSLNEKGSGLEGIETLIPHPDFRLILTMNPEHGELSRAMRNRGIEIFVQTRFYFEDFLMLLNQNGFEPEEKKPCMTYCIMQTSYDTHKKITGEEPEEDGSMLAYFGLNYISTLTHQIRRGIDVDKILADLLIAYYNQKGFAEQCADETLRAYIVNQMNKYRETYEVNLVDERYKWRHLRHDLVSLTGGDAITAMLDRDNRIFYDDFNIDLLLKPDEMIENIDIVNTCITVKIFLELSTHGDFEHRKGFIRETFLDYPNMMNTVNNHVDLLHSEYIPLINSLLPRSDLTPVSEMHVDSRNSPDIHYYLQSLDYKGTIKREGLQNRWLLSLHRIMLRMIVELVEERSMLTPGNTSLWAISEQIRTGEMLKENLIRPSAEIASDLYDLLNGILRVISNRCFDNQTVTKMISRLFWISYFICKLKRGYSKSELIAVCNQIPMLWALTYQKVIVPIIKDCDMSDLIYKNKKFSYRLQHICDFLDMTITKPGHIEKAYYNKVLNMYASTTKRCETISREVNKFFATLIGRYTTRSKTLSLGSSDNNDTLAASGIIWSNSTYMDAFYNIEDKLLLVELADTASDELVAKSIADQACEDAHSILLGKKNDYNVHEFWLGKEQYKTKCLHVNRRNNALDQFAPIWQSKFIQTKLAKLLPEISNPAGYRDLLRKMLKNIDGIILSPNYYATIIKCLQKLQERREISDSNNHKTSSDLIRIIKEDVDMYTAYLTDHLLENVVLDHQVVGWTKLRVTTSDLPSSAPLIPEYSPIVSLVASYCLDISHLKLNSCSNSNYQLDSMLAYLWRSYVPTKLDSHKNTQDIELAQNLIHLRSKLDTREEMIGLYQCGGSNNCYCIDEYIRRRVPTYDNLIKTMKTKLTSEDVGNTLKAIKLIYFGYLNFLEYAPVFTLDPSLRSREKLEVYKSELAHIKLDLQFRNTLFYWKTGENLQLNEIEPEDAALYPYSARVLVERRVKLEKSINKLRREYTNRPKSDDGSLYYELRKEIEVNINRYTNYIQSLMNDLFNYVNCKTKAKSGKFTNLITKCRMIIKSLARSISHLKSDYALYADLTINFLVGMCFVQQGLRCLYSRLEQRMQIEAYGFDKSIQEYLNDLDRVFSFNNFNQGNIESVNMKLEFFPRLDKICPRDKARQMRSLLLRTVLIQLNHHITITPSDIKVCIPIVRRIADLFHAAWLEHKLYLEMQRKQKEELYQYKTSRTTLGKEISYERQEFLEICAKFPTYDHVYQSHFSIPPTSADTENLETEEKMYNLSRSVDLSMCIDICKAHYKFINEASRNLLGQIDSTTLQKLPTIDLSQMIKLESETLYTIIRHCMPTLDQSFDSQSFECHLLQANQLSKILRQTKTDEIILGSLKSSIEILDEEIFDIYHNANAYEALKFQEFIYRIDSKIGYLRDIPGSSFESHPTLHNIIKLITRIRSFLITDPLMKFVTGSHTLLEKIEEWNQQTISKEYKMIYETEELIELIKFWRKMEIESWRSSLHRVKRKYIDNSLCDLWFKLYEVFNDPILRARNLLKDQPGYESFILTPECDEPLYQVFVAFIKDFFEEATLGDYQIRLDLVFSFAIQTRFASLFEQSQPNYINKNMDTSPEKIDEEKKCLQINFEKLTTYVYNTYRQYQGLFEPVKEILKLEENRLSKELNTEIRIVAWQGRNLWEIKNNFRISHRKLNKVMNKYLEVLRRPIPGLRPQGNLSDNKLEIIADRELDSDRVVMTLSNIKMLVDSVIPPSSKSINLSSLAKTPRIVKKMKQFHNTLHEPMTSRYIEKLVSIELFIMNNTQAVKNFHSHKVQEVTINPKDTKESKENKLKLCRQMYHSKKFALQSIFKNLQNLGVSYQRGLHCQGILDDYLLSMEPLRGMIQNQSQLVLKGVSKLIDDNIIFACNERYGKLIANAMFLLAQHYGESLSSDQMNRLKGFAIDMVLDISKLNRSAALMYMNLMDIQAATTRLTQLQQIAKSNSIVIYNFAKVHKSVRLFNELVGRAYLTTFKLEELAECFTGLSELGTQQNIHQSDTQSDPQMSNLVNEKSILQEMISEIKEENSLMTRKQFDHIKSNLLNVRKSIAEISYNLRDMLNFTIKNHVYGYDDLQHLERLYEQFYTAFSQLTSSEYDNLANLNPGTVLGSLKSLLKEAEQKLKPKLELNYFIDDGEVIDIGSHPNLKRLNIRLQKVIKQAMLAVQGIYKEELNHSDNSRPLGESAKRKLKPFNYIDSVTIKNLLRLSQVAKHTGNCFITLNREETSTNIEPFVAGLTPILFIYTQDVAYYLNIIITSLHLKLDAANQLIPFFTDLVLNGFGLPFKDTEETGIDDMKGKTSDDNTGFGEGQGVTDVSKKLEFESQLDDLKKDNSKKDQENNEDDLVEAHDDGVEMSEDIDAKAEGPEQNSQDEKKENDQNSEDENEDEYDDLDKELGTVDNDEGKLDEKLWDDKDEVLGEDDEQDLRETDLDPSMNSNKENGLELKAKDEKLTNSKTNEKFEDEKDEQKMEHENQVESSPTDQINELPIDDKEKEDKNGKLDLEEEAIQALNKSELNESTEPKDERDQEDDLIDMSISEDEDVNDDNLRKKDETITNNKEDENIEEDSGDKSEGELSQGEETNDNKSVQSSSQNVIDDDDIDNQLEEALQHPLYDVRLQNPIEETIRNLLPDEQSGRGQDPVQEMKGKKIGSHTLYNIYQEEDDDPIDFDEYQGQEEQHQETENNSEQRQPDEGITSEGINVDGDNHPMEIEEVTKDDDRIDEPLPSSEKNTKPIKRTFAEHHENEKNEIKRQKIVEATEAEKMESQAKKNEEDDEPTESKERSKGNKVRHIQEDKSSAVEVIDLVSSSEDECLDEHPDQIDQSKESNLQPKESVSSKKTVRNDNDVLENADPENIKTEEEIKDRETDKLNTSIDPPDIISSISSIESGELDLDSDGENNVDDLNTRNLNTTYNTNFGLLKYISLHGQESNHNEEKNKKINLMERIDNELSRKSTIEYDSVDMDRLTSLWLDCTKQTGHLVHELCQQLQIVLQPTKMSKYKGDYKSGKRLNMRKIISYIASHYRKDKIWLRRTKPNKRTYNITIAVDNSSSMSENSCRQMTYQSLALLAKSLSLIEAGSLNVVSFGEQVKCIHEFGQPYVDAIGAQWLRELRFNESRTSYKQLLSHSVGSFAKQAQSTQSQLNIQGSVSQLLVIISDGRNVTSEEDELKCHLRQLKSMGVLTLFVIIDDLKRNNGNSIVDVKRCIGIGGNSSYNTLSVYNYMELFPFPFYVLLRQLETMPSILGEALRQWFELVNNN